jgi:hypothetical protein
MRNRSLLFLEFALRNIVDLRATNFFGKEREKKGMETPEVIYFQVIFQKELFKYYFIKKVIPDYLEKVILLYSTLLILSVSWHVVLIC